MPPFTRDVSHRRPWAGRLSLWGPVAGYCAVIFGLSSVPDVASMPGGLSDKTVHALVYAGLGLLFARALAEGRGGRVTLGVACGAVLAATLYGLSDEVHQLFVPGRHFDLMDLAADGVGASVGTAAQWLWGIIRS